MWFRQPTGWMLGSECSWHCLHLRPNHPPESSNRQGHLYHHICLCPAVLPPWRQKGLLLLWAPSSSYRSFYRKDSHPLRWLGWSRWQVQCWISGSAWRTWLGHKNAEGESLLDFAMSCNLVNCNTCFKKRPNHLNTYTSGEGRTQIDFVHTFV